MLRECDQRWGDCAVVGDDPAVEKHYDVVFMPLNPNIWFEHDSNWGVYGADGSLIEAAAHRREPDGRLHGQRERHDFELNNIRERVVDETLVYGGPLIPHFGHFICSTLSRLWWVARDGLAGRRVVFHGFGPVRHELAVRPFLAALLGGLGLSADNLVILRRPTRLDRLIVPKPAFQEQRCASRAYNYVADRIGTALCGERLIERRRPVYLSKTGLQTGVWRFVNEAELQARLVDAGIEVVHPETLPVADQIDIFRQRRVVIGTTGSQFHTCALAPAGGRNLCLGNSNTVVSNFQLIDALRGRSSRYLYPEGDLTAVRTSAQFLSEFEIADPSRVAAELLEAVWREDALID